MAENGHGDITVAFAFLAGALVGAGIALLMAPKSGAELRSQVGEWLHDMQEKASEAVGGDGDEEGADGGVASARPSPSSRAS